MDIRFVKTNSTFLVEEFFFKWSKPGRYGCRLHREYNVYNELKKVNYEFTFKDFAFFNLMDYSVLVLPGLEVSKSLVGCESKIFEAISNLHNITFEKDLGYGWVESSSVFKGCSPNWELFLLEYVRKYLNKLNRLNEFNYYQKLVEELCSFLISKSTAIVHRDLKDGNWIKVYEKDLLFLIDWENSMLVPFEHVSQIEAAMYIVTYGIDNFICDILFRNMLEDEIFKMYLKIFHLGATSFAIMNKTTIPKNIDILWY